MKKFMWSAVVAYSIGGFYTSYAKEDFIKIYFSKLIAQDFISDEDAREEKIKAESERIKSAINKKLVHFELEKKFSASKFFANYEKEIIALANDLWARANELQKTMAEKIRNIQAACGESELDLDCKATAKRYKSFLDWEVKMTKWFVGQLRKLIQR